MEQKMCVLRLQFFSQTLPTLSRIQRDAVILCTGRHATYPLFLSDSNKTWIVSTN